MPSNHNRTVPPGVRVMFDGGTSPDQQVTKTVTADAVVTREVGDDEVDMLRVPISSTRPDREGDRFTAEALEDMAEQIKRDQPHVFDNHGMAGGYMDAIPYDSRETIGAQMKGEVEQDSDDGEYQLYAYVNPDKSHAEGERMLKQVRDEKQPIKFSVGFRVMGYEDIEDDAGNVVGREFTKADLMETSRVGIPANSDASVAMSAKGQGPAAFQMHPMFAQMQQGQEARADGGGFKAELEQLRDDVAELRETVDSLKDDGGNDGGEPTETNAEKAECPECGEDVNDDANYCPNCGEELDGDGDDGEDGDDEEDSADSEELAALREEVAEIRDAVSDGTGEPDTSDTDTTAEKDIPSDDGENKDESGDGADSETTKAETGDGPRFASEQR